MTAIDLNADLGESFGPWPMGNDAAMLDIVSSANVACGGHAGDPGTMFETLMLAKERGVVVGAHPGFEDKEGFGRRRIPLSMTEIEHLIASQVGSLSGVAALAGTRVRYVKPHGALGNWSAVDADVAAAIARSIRGAFPDYAVLAIPGSELDTQSDKAGLEVFAEVFADRGYTDDGNLVPRSEPGAMIEDADEACERLLQFLDTGKMKTNTGGSVTMNVQSICIHGDSPHSVAMAKAVRAMLVDSGVTISPFLSA